MSERRTNRARKSVDFYNPGTAPQPDAKLEVAQGHGIKLGDIPNVNFKLDKLKGTDRVIEHLHLLCWKTKGKALSRKKDIKTFSGYTFEESSKESELERLKVRVEKYTVPELDAMSDLLDLPRGSGGNGTKDQKVERIKNFLLSPSLLPGKDLGAEEAKRKAKKHKAAQAQKDAATSKKDAVKKASSQKPKSTPSKAKAEAEPKEQAAKKRKAITLEEKPVKKAKIQKRGEKSIEKKRWPPAKDVKADVESIFQAGLDKEDEMTMGKIYAELAEKYGMCVEEIKEKKDQIKGIVKDYEALFDGTSGEGTASDVLANPKGSSAEDAPVVQDKATTEGDENPATVAATVEAGETAQPEGTLDLQTAEPRVAQPEGSQLEAGETAQPEGTLDLQTAEPRVAQPGSQLEGAHNDQNAKPEAFQPEIGNHEDMDLQGTGPLAAQNAEGLLDAGQISDPVGTDQQENGGQPNEALGMVTGDDAGHENIPEPARLHQDSLI